MLQALSGFLMLLNADGDIYYASENVESFLGFMQSDLLHQSVFELIHSEDREELRQAILPTEEDYCEIILC